MRTVTGMIELVTKKISWAKNEVNDETTIIKIKIMEEENKELLLEDLCARLPYGVKVEHLRHAPNNPSDLFAIDVDKQLLYCDHKGREEWYKVEFVKPYLRPMSSMTEEEKKEYIEYAGYEIEESVNGRHYEYYLKDFVGTQEEPIANVDAIDWLNAHHFDYRGLIEKGLAIEVTKENNPYKN